jgi:hypothetical protein
MDKDLDSSFAALFTSRELVSLRKATVELGPDRRMDVPSLVGAWAKHVQKIEDDLDLPDSDRSVWGAHDLIAALTIRNAVERAVALVSTELSSRVAEVLGSVDEQFMSYTEDDPRSSLEKVDVLPADRDHWWWHRIPQRGPIRRDIDTIARAVS